ncbi:SDR family NAD(P)-dependent oxidoreductase [Haloprofundus salinisoli]|uniref:SDR family NAD(P)-dependent oxidoreductase n=1 Tax=Haloprofundus salinisoli TaxID=2876193 RepID=UPI001CCC967F|nr:SDR family NAD(P)-dependent oxidoreductase [Haloprofundus salinisoli]
MIEENGGEAVAVEPDLTDGEAVAALGDAVEKRFGRVDVLVNKAGIRIEGGPLTDVDTAAIERIVDVNLTGIMRACKHLIPPLMADTGGGTIVIISSANAEVGPSGWGPYDASKAGLLALTRNMAADHAADDIRVNTQVNATDDVVVYEANVSGLTAFALATNAPEESTTITEAPLTENDSLRNPPRRQSRPPRPTHPDSVST